MIRPVVLGVLMLSANVAGASDGKKAALSDAMNENGCQMTAAQANVQMPKPDIDRHTAIHLSRETMAEGIATFAADEETLLLLPPACKW